MKRKVGVSGQIFFNDNTWIKPEDSENLATNQKMEEQTSLRVNEINDTTVDMQTFRNDYILRIHLKFAPNKY